MKEPSYDYFPYKEYLIIFPPYFLAIHFLKNYPFLVIKHKINRIQFVLISCDLLHKNKIFSLCLLC